MTRAGLAWDHGLDGTGPAEDAIAVCKRAAELDPTTPIPHMCQGYGHVMVAEQMLERGQSPAPRVDLALSSAAESRHIAPNAILGALVSSRAHSVRCHHEYASGNDPRACLESQERDVDELTRLAPGIPHVNASRGVLEWQRAVHAFREGKDPEPMLARAREALDLAANAVPEESYWLDIRANIELLDLRWSMQQRRVDATRFAAAFALLRPPVEKRWEAPRLYVRLAELHVLHARWLVDQQRSAAEDIDRGLDVVKQALALHPHLATAFAAKGHLLLLKARASGEAQERAAAAEAAREAFETAFKENPLLEREHGDALREAKSLR